MHSPQENAFWWCTASWVSRSAELKCKISRVHCLVAVCQPFIKLLLTYLLLSVLSYPTFLLSVFCSIVLIIFCICYIRPLPFLSLSFSGLVVSICQVIDQKYSSRSSSSRRRGTVL